MLGDFEPMLSKIQLTLKPIRYLLRTTNNWLFEHIRFNGNHCARLNPGSV